MKEKIPKKGKYWQIFLMINNAELKIHNIESKSISYGW